MSQALPDIVAEGLKILFIGYNPGLRSAEVGHHFASPSNRFWDLLHKSGLTPRRYAYSEDVRLPELGYGLTNIVHRPTRSAAELKKEEYEEGRSRLAALLRTYKPRIACYVGIGVYKAFSNAKSVECGLQPVSVIEGVKDFVVPSPSGLNRIPYMEILSCFNKLKELAAD